MSDKHIVKTKKQKKVSVLLILLLLSVLIAVYIKHISKVVDLCKKIEQGNKTDAMEIIDKMVSVNVSTGIYGALLYVEAGECEGTPLLSACRIGDEELITQLLDKGANPNYSTFRFEYPLEQYVDTGYEPGSPTLHRLIEAGADPNLYRFFSALSILGRRVINLEKGERLDIITNDIYYLIENGANIVFAKEGSTLLHDAAMSADSALLKYLLQDKNNLEYIDKKRYDGFTPLISAVYCERIENIKLLMESGANKDIIDNAGKTAMDYAKEQGNQEIIELLLG